MTVGILSDSFDTSGGAADTMATDIANGYLPGNTQDVADSANGTDEGRAMAQIVHEIAPGAGDHVRDRRRRRTAFANNILDLAGHLALVIVDDISYLDEPAYQHGVIAQAVDPGRGGGRRLSPAAGNNGANGYEGANAGATFGYEGASELPTISPNNPLLPVTLTAGTTISFVLDWAQPAASARSGNGATTGLDLFLTNASGSRVYGTSLGRQSRRRSVRRNKLQPDDLGTYYLRVGLYAGPAPSDIKIMALGDGYPP